METTMDKFRKSSFCGDGLVNTCVEVAINPNTAGPVPAVIIRNNASPEKQIGCSRNEWRAFIAGVKNGEFDT